MLILPALAAEWMHDVHAPVISKCLRQTSRYVTSMAPTGDGSTPVHPPLSSISRRRLCSPCPSSLSVLMLKGAGIREEVGDARPALYSIVSRTWPAGMIKPCNVPGLLAIASHRKILSISDHTLNQFFSNTAHHEGRYVRSRTDSAAVRHGNSTATDTTKLRHDGHKRLSSGW